ncbi:hypothetical protein ACOSQ2_023260 [Xanthoceras sorbifolium]
MGAYTTEPKLNHFKDSCPRGKPKQNGGEGGRERENGGDGGRARENEARKKGEGNMSTEGEGNASNGDEVELRRGSLTVEGNETARKGEGNVRRRRERVRVMCGE